MTAIQETTDGIPRKIDTIDELVIKSKCWVEKNNEERLAEVLSIDTRKSPPRFYVHYVNYNKRLDEWIFSVRHNLNKEV